MNEKYGVDHYSKTPDYSEKYKTTMNERYGVDNPMKSDEIKQKMIQNSLEKNGVEWSLSLPEVQQKIKDTWESRGFKRNSSTNEWVEKTKESSHKNYGTNHPMQIDYVFEGKTKIYHPDIYIISENKVIEVKSTYTIKVDVEKNAAKRKAVLDKGMNFEFMIF